MHKVNVWCNCTTANMSEYTTAELTMILKHETNKTE